MGRDEKKKHVFWSPGAQITINLALTSVSIALTFATVWLMHRSNLATKISTYSDHQPMLAVDNEEGLTVDRVKIPWKEPDLYDAELHFVIRNLGTGIAQNVNYAVLNFLDGHEVGGANLSGREGGKIMRVDYSVLPGGTVRVSYADKSYILAQMLERNNNEKDCVIIVLSYEQRNLDGSVFPQHYFVRLRPYWIDKPRKIFKMLFLEQRYTESMPLGLRLAEGKQHPFQPILHVSAGEPVPRFIWERKGN